MTDIRIPEYDECPDCSGSGCDNCANGVRRITPDMVLSALAGKEWLETRAKEVCFDSAPYHEEKFRRYHSFEVYEQKVNITGYLGYDDYSTVSVPLEWFVAERDERVSLITAACHERDQRRAEKAAREAAEQAVYEKKRRQALFEQLKNEFAPETGSELEDEHKTMEM